MRVLFAVSNSEDSKGDIVDVICNEYQKEYKKIISYKRVFYYDAIINEIRQSRDNKYDRIIISEDFEKNINDSYESEDTNLYRRIDQISDEAYKDDGTAIPIILLCSDRRSERDPIISKLFVLGVYNILLGKERTIQNVCALIDKPRNKRIAKVLYNIAPDKLRYTSSNPNQIVSDKELMSILKFFNTYKDKVDKCVRGFAKLSRMYTEEQLQLIIMRLPLDVKLILEENSNEYSKVAKESVKKLVEQNKNYSIITRDLTKELGVNSKDVIIPKKTDGKGVFKRISGKK